MFQIRKIFTKLLAATLIVGCFYTTTPTSASPAQCDDLKIIFARGSGEKLHDISETAWRESLEQNLQTTALKYSFYELGSEKQSGYQYPAAAVSGSVDGVMNLLGAYISAGSMFDFGNSVFAGQQELLSYVNKVSADCPNTKFVLGGYSQGAMLISGLLNQLDANRIVYIATFGDPKLYLPEGKGVFPDACFGKNLSEYRVNVMDCHAYEGILGSYRPYQPEEYHGKIGVWCNNNDIMCSSKASISDHTSYVASNLYGQAAQVIIRKLRDIFSSKVSAEVASKEFSTHDLAILIDSTGSMSDIINSYKSEAKRLAQKIIRQGGRVALFEYRDLSEGFETRKLCDFGTSYGDFVTQIDQITTNGGGDWEESALSGTLHVMNSLKWQAGSTKSIILLTDAGYHNPDVDGTDFGSVVARSLEIDPVNIYVLTTPDNTSTYAELTTATNGRIFNVETEIDLSSEIILERPNINFPLASYYGTTATEFTFTLLENENLQDLTYEWDFDNDGIFELQSNTGTVSQTFKKPFTGFVQAKVTTKSGNTSTASAQLTVVKPEDVQLASIETLESKSLNQNYAEINFTSINTHTIVVTLNDNIIGKIDPAQTSFQLSDLTSPITLTLIPYNHDGARGESRSITVSPRLPKAPRTGTNNTVLNFNICNLLDHDCLTALNSNGNDCHIRIYKQ